MESPSPTTDGATSATAAPDPHTHSEGPLRPTHGLRRSLTVFVAAAVFGLVCGAFEITNTSIGWHIASGRWMLSHGEVLDHDPFSFTSGEAEWIDHEWLFQIIVAAVDGLGGPPLLVVMRMVLVAVLALVLTRIGISGGLDPPLALLVAALCVLGARPRFFLRPELFTLILVPVALFLFAERERHRWWPLPLVAVLVVGANLHGGILVVPVLLSARFAGEVLEQLVLRKHEGKVLASGAVGLAAAFLAPVLNPHGAAIWTVPFRLADMVGQPHIPNPEWISPGPGDAPSLFLGAAVAVLVLGLGRSPLREWFTVGTAAALALRHIRNLGLFFVTLPQSLASALARLPVLADAQRPRGEAVTRAALGLALLGVLAVAAVLRPWPHPGFGFADRWYPERAWGFLEANDLLGGPLYNDVRFGGWLIERGYSEGRKVFLDDRNEINEPLLEEIWEIFRRSDVAGWEALLGRWGIDTVLLRYHEPIRVATPDGVALGRRGFSTLWFPPSRWALVYWDDVAMVIVRRSAVSEELLAAHEYRHLHPDDLEHLLITLREDPALRPLVADELRRALADDPGCRRALALAARMQQLDD